MQRSDTTEAAIASSLDVVLPGVTDRLHEQLQARVVDVSPSRIVATMPVAGNTQPHGFLFGGASAMLAEALGSIGSALHAGPRAIAVGTDLNATHHRSVRTGEVTATASALHLGRTTCSWEVVVVDDRDRRVCTARISCALVPIDRTTA